MKYFLDLLRCDEPLNYFATYPLVLSMMYSLVYPLFAFNMLSAQPLSEQTTQPRTLSVLGSAEIKVIPDQALVSFTVQDKGVNLQQTQRENDKTIKDFIQYMTKELNIDSTHIHTDHIEVYPEYQYCNYDDNRKCDPLAVQFYSVMKHMQIQINNLEQYEPLLNEAFNMGISQINHVQFQSSDIRKYKDQAREKAAGAAKEKANAIAETLGMTVLKPISIQLNTPEYGMYSGYNSRSGIQTNALSFESGGEGVGVAIGQISISANVHVVFEIE